VIKLVGVVGLGNIAVRHRRNVKALFDGVRVIAMPASGRMPKEGIEHADTVVPNIQSMIELNPDFVIVASPATKHSEHSIPLLLSAIPVLIEKPLAGYKDDALKLAAVASQCETPVAVGYCLRYLHSSLLIREMLSSEVIGSMFHASVNMGQYLPQWRPNKHYTETVSAQAELGGGVLLELSHELDYMQWLCGEMEPVYSHLRNSKALNLGVEESADIMLVSRGGCVCHMHLDFLQHVPSRKCSFVGTKGRLDWDLIGNCVTLQSEGGEKVLYCDPTIDRNEMYVSMIKDFVALIQGQENKCVDVHQAARTVELIDEIKAEAIWGKVI